ncbi:MAG TPA: SPOR domain-containing protein [Bacteroidia bacterium]|nr:SPOR domain-containing protein [Bacteroidia bacterium]HMU19293.1 SPOR domain-containing protein [Bacteroidia bacterium]
MIKIVKNVLLIICCILFHVQTKAQTGDDSLTHVLIKKHIAYNMAKPFSQGYRIQLYFGSQRDKAYELRTEFIKLYPQTAAYVLYQQPNFKLRVGDFRTRLDAQKSLKELQAFYPSAFLVKDDIKLKMDE